MANALINQTAPESTTVFCLYRELSLTNYDSSKYILSTQAPDIHMQACRHKLGIFTILPFTFCIDYSEEPNGGKSKPGELYFLVPNSISKER